MFCGFNVGVYTYINTEAIDSWQDTQPSLCILSNYSNMFTYTQDSFGNELRISISNSVKQHVLNYSRGLLVNINYFPVNS